MYRIRIKDAKNSYELTELAKMFVSADSLDIDVLTAESPQGTADFTVPAADEMDRNAQKRAMYRLFAEKTGKELDWGILTGVRPVKLFAQTASAISYESNAAVGKDVLDAAEIRLQEEYLVSPEKTYLLRYTYEVQQRKGRDKDPRAVGLYVGIPFCPTRCLYCSFTSNRFTEAAAAKYLNALYKEIAAVRGIMENKGLYAESIYLGGGTPTSLTEEMFAEMTGRVSDAFLRPKTAEYTVECGRPDTSTVGKLKSLKPAGAGRISINPQTMKEDTLRLIGRQHSPSQIEEAFALARSCGIDCINMDLIAGLPEESTEDFADSLDGIIAMGPENITVHTLAVKKGSRLIEADKNYSYRQEDTVRSMLRTGSAKLGLAGYEPYYLYRQKHMAGNFENVGYCKDGTASLYNIRIMDEDQSIIALGAGGISKVYYPEENRLERVPNVSNYEIYIDRIDEMIERKVKGI